MKQIKQFFIRPYIYLIFVIIGTSLKFSHLGDRYFWLDEIATIAHTTGLTVSEFSDLIPLNEITNIQTYQSEMHLNKQDYRIDKQITGLFSTTNLTPLHYVFLMFWYRIVGDDFAVYRLFSVFIFILTLPLLFILVKKLFKTNLSGWIAVSLFSVSPFFHLYAQEARYYILWAFFLILFHLLFLQVITYNKLRWWITYTITGILVLYISVFSGIALLGHIIYIWILHKEHRKIHMINIVLILLFYTPWIHSMFINRKEIFTVMSWQTRIPKVSLWDPIIGQLNVFIRTFVNLNLNPLSELIAGNQSFSILFGLGLDICVLGLIITAIIHSEIHQKRFGCFLYKWLFPQFCSSTFWI
jgi:uncharacterized membrane protein